MSDYSLLGKPRELIVRGDREKTINNYRLWLWQKINGDYSHLYYSQLYDLHYFNALACWCWAKEMPRCEIIVKAVEWVDKQIDEFETEILNK